MVWATPAILSVSNSGAAASPIAPACAASAYNVLATGTVAGAAVAVGPIRSSPPDVGSFAGFDIPGVISTGALSVSAGETRAGTCMALSVVDSTSILGGLVSTGFLQSSISWPERCDAPSVFTSVAGLTVNGIPQGVSTAPRTLSIDVPQGLLTAHVDITANQQSCMNGTITADVLVIHVTIPASLPGTSTDLTVTLGHTRVQNGCPC